MKRIIDKQKRNPTPKVPNVNVGGIVYENPNDPTQSFKDDGNSKPPKWLNDLVDTNKQEAELIRVSTDKSTDVEQKSIEINKDLDQNLTKLNKNFEKLGKNVTQLTKDMKKIDIVKTLTAYQERIKAQNDEAKDIANTAAGTFIPRNNKETFAEKIYSVKEKFNDIKQGITDTRTGKFSVAKSLGTVKDAIMSSMSDKYAAKVQYKRDQLNLGSKLSDKELNQSFETRHKALISNERNESFLQKNLGGLTKEEFLQGGSKAAKKYEAEQIRVGKILKGTDHRHVLADKNKEPEQSLPIYKPVEKPKNKFQSAVNASIDAMPSKESIQPMLSSAEDKMESNRELSNYHDSHIKLMEEQNEILNQQLDTQKELLDEFKKKQKELPNESGTHESSPLSIIEDVADIADDVFDGPRRKDTGKPSSKKGRYSENKMPKGKGRLGKFLDKGKGILSKGAKSVSSLGRAALPAIEGAAKFATPLLEGAARFAGPVGIALTVGEGLHEGAKAFAGTFGEGGFELIQKLRKEDAISYGWGTTPKVDDWKKIEALSNEELKTLIDTNEFEGKDLEKITQLYQSKTMPTAAVNGEAVTPSPVMPTAAVNEEAVTPSPVMPTAAVNEEAVTPSPAMPTAAVNGEAVTPSPVMPTVPESVPTKMQNIMTVDQAKPEIISRPTADSVYSSSANNIEEATRPVQQPVPSTINAPTTNISNQVNKKYINEPIKNTDQTISNLFSGRQRFNS